MEFDIDQARFLAALTLAGTVADKRATMPHLANVLLRVSSGALTCSATDLTISLADVIHGDAIDVRSDGALMIAVRHLHNVVRNMPEGHLSFVALDNHWAKISSQRIEFRLMGAAEHDFPALPSTGGVTWYELPAHLLSDLVARTLFSVSTDEARLNLNGALLESDAERITMVSTDGHRLTRHRVGLGDGTLVVPKGGVIVPRKGLVELKRVLERSGPTISLAFGEQHLFLRGEDLTLSIKLNAATFPPYAQVIPSEARRRVFVGRMELLFALRRAVLTAPEKTAPVRLDLKSDVLEITSDNPDLGLSRQELPIELQGDPLVAGFNATYLIEALEALGNDGDRVELQFQGELDPCVVRPSEHSDFLAVVMPMKI